MTNNIIPFKTSKAEGLFVEVPDGARFSHIKENSKGHFLQCLSLKNDQCKIELSDYLPKGNYRVIGKVEDLTVGDILHACSRGASLTWLVVVKED